MIIYDSSSETVFGPCNLKLDAKPDKCLLIFDDEIWDDYVLMNKWFGKEALKILNASTGIDFWYEWSQSGNRARFSISKQSARLASVVYCYMIGDFSSAIDRIEYLQNQNIARTDRSSLLGIFIKSSLLSGNAIRKEEIQQKFSIQKPMNNFFLTLVSTCQPMLIVVVLVAVVVEINWKRRFQKLRSKRKKEVFVLNAYLLG